MKNSKTPEMEKRDLTALKQEDIEKVSGGYVYYNRDKADYNWEAINDKDGSVIGRYRTKQEARNKAKSEGNLDDRIWFGSTLNQIRSDEGRGTINAAIGAPNSNPEQ